MAKKEVTVMYDLSDFKDFKRYFERVCTIKTRITSKPIREYNTNGKFIKLWPNLKYLSDSKGLSYTKLMNHLSKGYPLTFNNRIYLRGKDEIKDRVALLQREVEKKAIAEYAKKSQQVYVYTSDGKFVNTFKSQSEASKNTKVNKNNLYNCIEGKALITGGYIFLSPFETIEERLEKIKNRKTWKTNY